MTFDEWKQKNYKQWNTEQAYMIASQGTPEEENAIDRYSKMIWEASQPKWTYCKDGMPTEDGNYLVAVLLPYGHRTVLSSDYNANNCDFCEIDPDREVIAWMPLPEAPNVHDD